MTLVMDSSGTGGMAGVLGGPCRGSSSRGGRRSRVSTASVMGVTSAEYPRLQAWASRCTGSTRSAGSGSVVGSSDRHVD
jgi:hypothetical protein